MEVVVPKLKPLEAWICDKCGKVTDVKNGYLKWLSPDGRGRHSFEVIHNIGCHENGPTLDEAGNHLEYFIGVDGLQCLLSMLDVGVVLDPLSNSSRPPDLRSFTDTVRRLHIPYYEEARTFFATARSDGWFSDQNEGSIFLPSTCLAIIERYQGQLDA
jgi:hypothetical protein